MSETSRRALLAGAGAVGVAGVLAACGDDPPSSTQPTTGSNPTTGAPIPSPSSGSVLAKKADIPVGSGKIIFEEAVVVTQPSAGQFLGFSAICTHQGCVVSKVQGDTITCGCHGSEYSVKDGSVKKGPAPKALDKQPIKVDGDAIKLA